MNVNGRGFGVLTMNMEKTVCEEVVEPSMLTRSSSSYGDEEVMMQIITT